MKKIATLFTYLFLVGSFVTAQNINPGADEIYKTDEVAIIRLTMEKADSAFLLDDANIWFDEYLPASFQFTNSLMDTVLDFSVGVRLRGNTSRSHPKKSINIKFKEFDGEKFYGYKKFNMKAENNDPSVVREMLTMRAFREFNVPATRTHHAELYLNGTYMGIYLNVEQIDDEFVQLRFGDDTGNLYKCEYGASMKDDGQIYDNVIYELKSNEDANDRSILNHFVEVLNSVSDDEFNAEIEPLFNVDGFIRYLALETLTGHWDGYSYNQNNFYLYENPVTGKVEFIPYDTDNTFGVDWIGGDWGTRNVLEWATQRDARPLTNRILAQENYFRTYKKYLDELLKGDFSESYYFPIFEEFNALLDDAVARDTHFSLTFGFTYDDFKNSLSQSVADHLPYSLKNYVTTRTTTAREQIGTIASIRSLSSTATVMYPNPSRGNEITIQSEADLKNIAVLDIAGRSRNYTMDKIADNNYRLNFNLRSGIYFIKSDNTMFRFVVE